MKFDKDLPSVGEAIRDHFGMEWPPRVSVVCDHASMGDEIRVEVPGGMVKIDVPPNMIGEGPLITGYVIGQLAARRLFGGDGRPDIPEVRRKLEELAEACAPDYDGFLMPTEAGNQAIALASFALAYIEAIEGVKQPWD